MSDRTPLTRAGTVPLPELATCRHMDWPEGRQVSASFNKERDSCPAERAGHARFEFEARSTPQGSRPARPPAPSPSLPKPCLAFEARANHAGSDRFDGLAVRRTLDAAGGSHADELLVGP